MKRGRGKSAIVLSVLGALILLLAACAPAATPTPTPTPLPPGMATPTPAPGVATPAPGVATPAPGVATPTPAPTTEFIIQNGVRSWGPQYAPVYGETYRKFFEAEPPHFDSHRQTASQVGVFTHPVFSSLIRWSPMRDRKYADWNKLSWLEPDLAERWEVSPDSLVYTFYLRKGVKFHDGVPFTAKDVKYSFDKLMDPKRSAFILETAMIERTEVVDDYTVKFYLKWPSGMFLRYMAFNNFFQIQPEHLKDVSYRTTAFLVGTGGFKFKEYHIGADISYVRNPDYHFKGRPYFDGWQVFFLTAAAARSAFVAGRLDEGNLTSTDDEELFRRLVPEGIMVPSLTGIQAGVYFNFVKEGPGQDVRVRRAMMLAMDFYAMDLASKGGLTQRANYKTGYFFSAPTGPGLPWSEYEKAWWQNKPMAERIAEAKRLLAQAGYPNGFKGSVLASDSASTRADTQVFIDNMRKINIDLTAEFHPRTTQIERRHNRQWDFLRDPWPTYTLTAEQLLGAPYVKGGSHNFGLYEHPLIEEIYRKLQREMDEEKRSQLVHQAERLLMDDIPIVVFSESQGIRIYRPYFKPGYPFLPVDHSGPQQWIYEITWFDKADPSWAIRK